MRILQLEALDGSKWFVPLALVETSYAAYYGDENVKPTKAELIDWAQNDMNWRDVKAQAVQVKGADPSDMDDSWTNGKMAVIEQDMPPAPDAAWPFPPAMPTVTQADALPVPLPPLNWMPLLESLEKKPASDEFQAAIAEVEHITQQAVPREKIDILTFSVAAANALDTAAMIALYHGLRDDADTILAGVEPGDHGDAILAAFGKRVIQAAIEQAAGL